MWMTNRESGRRGDRRAERTEVLASCKVMRMRDRAIVARVATDFSATGMQVLTADKVLTGERVRVVACLPRTERWLTVDAHVARVIHGRRPGESGRRLGLELEGLSPEEVAKLRDEAHRLLAVEPATQS